MTGAHLVRTTRALVLTAAVLGTAAACGGSSGGGQPAASGPPQHPNALVGTVGKDDAFTISLTDDAGDAIRNLAAGSYKLTVNDDSGLHNFHITGSGVDDKTEVTKAQVKTFTINVKPGTYTFLCDSHPSTMKGSFTVT
jgi:plastocyanin